MKKIKSLWALLPMACLMLASCSSDEATESAQQNPENLKPVATIDIPITATAVVDGSKTRAEVSTDNKTLVFATGDSLWVTGKLSAESANDGDTNYPYTLNGWLSLGASGNAYQNPSFVGTLKYTEYEYTDPEHGYYDSHDWPGLGDKNPVRNYDSNTSFKLHAVLKGLYQDEASWPGEVSDVSQLTSLNFSNHPICQANGNSSALNEAVKKYSLLVGTADDNGIRIPSDNFRVMFHLNQQTVFLNFTITFTDGTKAGEQMTATFANNGSTLGTGTVTTILSGDAIIANFVVPVAAGTVLNNATISISSYDPMPVGSNETLVAGTVYTINKSIDPVQLWEGGPYFALKNIGATGPADFGLYFAWGEIVGYPDGDASHHFCWNEYDDDNEYYDYENHEWVYPLNLIYKWTNGLYSDLTKYVMESDSYVGYDNFYDNKAVLESADDAAVANWGNGWRMPTADELIPLVNADGSNRVTCTWVYNYNDSGVDGCIFTGNTDGYRDHSIFLPAAGYYDSGYATNNSYHQVTNFAFVWTSSLCEYSSEKAWRLSAGFSGGSAYTDINNYDGSLDGNRYEGLSVRAVR